MVHTESVGYVVEAEGLLTALLLLPLNQNVPTNRIAPGVTPFHLMRNFGTGRGFCTCFYLALGWVTKSICNKAVQWVALAC